MSDMERDEVVDEMLDDDVSDDDSYEIEETSDDDESVSLSKDEYEKLSKGESTNDRLAAALERIAGERETPTQTNVGDPFALALNDDSDIDDEEFEQRLFEKGHSKKAIESLLAKRMQPILQRQQAKMLSYELRTAIAEDGDIAPYADEVKSAIGQLPPEKRIQDGIVQAAIAHVKQQHSDEILDKKVNDLVEQRLREKAESTKPTDFSEGMGDGGARGSGKRKVRMTSGQRADYEAKARARGITFDDYVQFVVGGK